MKTLPDKVRSYSNGLMVHDMHAEILALRLFNYYLLEKDCPLVGHSVLKHDVKLALLLVNRHVAMHRCPTFPQT